MCCPKHLILLVLQACIAKHAWKASTYEAHGDAGMHVAWVVSPCNTLHAPCLLQAHPRGSALERRGPVHMGKAQSCGHRAGRFIRCVCVHVNLRVWLCVCVCACMLSCVLQVWLLGGKGAATEFGHVLAWKLSAACVKGPACGCGQRSYGGMHTVGGCGSGPMAVYMLQVGVAAVLWRCTCCRWEWQRSYGGIHAVSGHGSRLAIAATGLSLPQQACRCHSRLVSVAESLFLQQ